MYGRPTHRPMGSHVMTRGQPDIHEEKACQHLVKNLHVVGKYVCIEAILLQYTHTHTHTHTRTHTHTHWHLFILSYT